MNDATTPRDGEAERLMFVGVDTGDNDETAVGLRVGENLHIIPDPFASVLMEELDSRDAALREAQAEIEALKHDIERALQSIGTAEAEVDRLGAALREAKAEIEEWHSAYLRLAVLIPEVLNAGKIDDREKLWSLAETELAGLLTNLGRETDEQADEIERLKQAAATDEGWKSIETAPKDGTKILVARAGEDISADPIEITEWFKTEHVHFEPVAGEENLYYRRGTTYYEGWNGNGHRATHWRPLPAPPPAPGDRAGPDQEAE